MAGEPLPAPAAHGGKLLDAFLFQALAQFGLAPPLLPVALLSVAQLAVKGAIMFAVAGGEEVGNAHIYAHNRGSWLRMNLHDFIVAEGKPPLTSPLVESHARVEGLARQHLAMVICQLDGYPDGLPFLKGTDPQPVVKGRILRRFKGNHIDIGLDASAPQGRRVPCAPGGCRQIRIKVGVSLCFLVGCEVLQVVLIGVGAPGLRNTCRLLNNDAVPAYGEGGGKQRRMEFVRLFPGTEEGDVLLAEREISLGKRIECGELARIDLT